MGGVLVMVNMPDTLRDMSLLNIVRKLNIMTAYANKMW